MPGDHRAKHLIPAINSAKSKRIFSMRYSPCGAARAAGAAGAAGEKRAARSNGELRHQVAHSGLHQFFQQRLALQRFRHRHGNALLTGAYPPRRGRLWWWRHRYHNRRVPRSRRYPATVSRSLPDGAELPARRPAGESEYFPADRYPDSAPAAQDRRFIAAAHGDKAVHKVLPAFLQVDAPFADRAGKLIAISVHRRIVIVIIGQPQVVDLVRQLINLGDHAVA